MKREGASKRIKGMEGGYGRTEGMRKSERGKG